MSTTTEMTTRERAIQMLAEFHGTYREDRHGQQARNLAAVLAEHPEAHLEACCDERTGRRYGNAACRAGRCVKVGYTTFQYQLWAVWA